MWWVLLVAIARLASGAGFASCYDALLGCAVCSTFAEIVGDATWSNSRVSDETSPAACVASCSKSHCDCLARNGSVFCGRVSSLRPTVHKVALQHSLDVGTVLTIGIGERANGTVVLSSPAAIDLTITLGATFIYVDAAPAWTAAILVPALLQGRAPLTVAFHRRSWRLSMANVALGILPSPTTYIYDHLLHDTPITLHQPPPLDSLGDQIAMFETSALRCSRACVALQTCSAWSYTAPTCAMSQYPKARTAPASHNCALLSAPRIANVTGGAFRLILPDDDRDFCQRARIGYELQQWRLGRWERCQMYTAHTAPALVTRDAINTRLQPSTTYTWRLVAHEMLARNSTSSVTFAVRTALAGCPATRPRLRILHVFASTVRLRVLFPLDLNGAQPHTLLVQLQAHNGTMHTQTFDAHTQEIALHHLDAESNHVVRSALQLTDCALRWSSIVAFSTPAPALPSRVRDLAIADSSSTTLNVRWRAPLSSGGVPLHAYVVRCCLVSALRSDAEITEHVSADTMQLQLTNLVANSTYNITVHAVNRARLVASTFIMASTLAHDNIEMDVANVTCRARTGGSLLLKWSVPRNASGGTYVLTSPTTSVELPWTTNSMVVSHNVLISTAMTFTLQCVRSNRIRASTLITCETVAATRPAATSAPTLLRVSGGRITVATTPPSDTGGVPLLAHAVVIRLASEARTTRIDVPLASTIAKISNLRPEMTYTVAYQSQNRKGWSELSPSLRITTSPATTPTPPRHLGLLETPSSSSVHLRWDQPGDTGGHRFLRYLVHVLSTTDMGSSSVQTVASETTTAIVSGLQPNTAYRASVVATIRCGATSHKSKQVTFSTAPLPLLPTVRRVAERPAPAPAAINRSCVWHALHAVALGNSAHSVTLPGPCILPVLAAENSGGALHLTWTPPMPTADIVSYDVLVVCSDTTRLLSTPAPAISIAGLLPKTSYHVQVAARTLAGRGAWTTPGAFATSDVSPPSPPSTLRILQTTGGAASILVGAPIDTGGVSPAELLYAVSIDARRLHRQSYAVSAINATHIRLQIGLLAPGTTYNVQVQAISPNVGGSAWTPTLSVTTSSSPIIADAVPIVLQQATGGALRVRWPSVVDDGGAPIESYTVLLRHAYTIEIVAQCTGTAPTGCWVRGLAPSTDYLASLVVHNTIGSSAESPFVVAATTPVTPPTSPSHLCGTFDETVEAVQLVWSPPLDIGGAKSDDLYYVVSADEDPPHITTATTWAIPMSNISSRVSISVTAATTWGSSAPAILVLTGKDACAPTSIDWWREINGSFASSCPECETTPAHSSYAAAPNRFLAETNATVLSTVVDGGEVGHINTTLAYQPNAYVSWLILPSSPDVSVLLHVYAFEMECDNDKVAFFEVHQNGSEQLMWQGGCARPPFTLQSRAPGIGLRMILAADDSIQLSGVHLRYHGVRGVSLDALTIPCPTSCGRYGLCRDDGTCDCRPRFSGEGCTNHDVCPHHPACYRPDSIVVDERFGSDTLGTGGLRQNKALQSLTRALELVPPNGTIVMYPGTYTDARTCNVVLEHQHVTITSLVSTAWSDSDLFAISMPDSALVVDVNCTGALASWDIRKASVVRLSSLRLIGGIGPSARLQVADSQVVLTHVSVRGAVSSSLGGGLAAANSELVFSDVDIEDCVATTGGGVYLEHSSLKATTSSISHNTATSDGGGVSLYSSTLHGARVALNTAARYGGGIAVTGIDNNLWNGTVFNNSAGGGGGLAVLSAASLVMERIRILGNTAMTGGGLLLLSTQSLSVKNTTVALNTAVQGGGLALQSLSNSSFDVSELALFENHAADTGGGLYVHASSVLLDGLFVARCTSNGTGGGLAAHNSNMGLLNTTIVNNSAATSGGGLFGFNSTIAGATVAIRSNAASVGGGMCLLMSRVKSMHIIANSARLDGGGVAASNSSYLADLVLAANQAARDGGGLHLSGWISIQNTSVLDSCAQQRGGGAFVTPSSTVACSGLVLDANTADDGGGAYLDGPNIALRGTCATTRNRARVAGGGITCSKSCQLDGPRLLRNSADTLGGGFLCTNGSCTVRNGRLQGNRAMRGGGLGAHYATVSLERCNITFNSALVTGGGISAQNSSVRLLETRVTSCSATESGGGLALADATVLGANASIFNNTAHRFGGNVVGTSCSIINLTIENGSAAHGGGVAILQGGASTVTNVSLDKNVARQTGGGLFIQNATVHHTNTTIVDNLAPRGASVALTGASAFLGAATTQYLATTILTATRSSSGHVYVAPHTTAVVSAVHISYGAAQHGGGLYIDVNSSFAGDRIVLEKNIAVAGGGIYAASSARVALANVTLRDNVADDGGGMYVVSAHLSLQRVVMMANFANATGGAIALINSSSAAFSCAFSSNTARDRGGAIALTAASRFALTSTRLTANAASNGGSVALCGFSTVTLTNCSVRGGDTTSFLGGLVYADASTVVLEASTRLANGVATRGGAVYLTNAASMYCHTVQLTLNVATRDGGGIFATGNATSVELQCTFVDANRAEGCGGGVYLDAGAALLMADNSSVQNCDARGHGGGIYLHGALSTAAQLYGSNVLGNNATGHGGGIFAGHGSQLVVIDTQVLRNYGQHSGGGLFATTAKVTCVHATFANNSATTGGGVFLDRTSSLHSLASIFSLNTAETTGGALVLASRSVGAIVNCTFTTNVAAAGNGGAIALERAAQGTLLECVATNNSSPNGMGGGLFASHSARVSDTGSRWTLNTAKDGAAMALVSPGPHQTINATFFMNAAQRQGGGLYLDKGAEMSAFTSLVVLNNSAMSGGGIFWVVDPPSGAHFFCDNCSLDNNEPTDVATSAVSVRVKAWPSSFSSDVPLTVGGNASAYVASALLTSPFSWATVQTTDYYGHVARLDNATTCTLSASAAGLALAPGGATYSAVNGLVTFARAAIQGPIVVAAVPVSVVVDCSRLGAPMIPLQIDMLMTPCAPGYSTDAAGRCVRCPSGQYSLNGTACFSCPPGAVCSEYILTTGTPALVGVAHPRTLPNYYLDRAPATHVTTQCDPLNWPSRDPCRAFALSSDDMEAALTQCLTSVVPVTYVASWPPMREFMCLSGLAFYPCQVENVCLGNIDSLLGHACAVGYAGSLCGRCASGYSNTISGTCQYCNGKWTSLTWQNALAPCLGLVVLACLIGALRLYLIDGSERELLRQAKLDQQLKARTKQRLTWWASARSNCHKKYLAWQARRRPQAPPRDVFGITLDTDGRPDYVSVYLEKAKILTGFFQIFGNFRTTYAIAWPPAINDAMVATSQFSLDLVAIAGIDCFMPSTSFYVQFISTLAVLAFIFALVFIFYYRGAAHYIGKLKTIPRCCPRCGLPVWDKYVPDMAQRRPSMPQPLSGSRQKRRRQSLEQRASTLLSLDDVSSAHGTIAARRVLTALRALLTEPDPHTSRARQLQREAINMSTAKAYTGALPMYRPTHRVCPAKPLTAHVRSRVLRSNLCVWQARVKLRLHYQSYRIKCVKVMLGILLLLYPMVSRNFLLVFHCDQVGARYWLVKDRSLECYTTEWSLYACVALAGVGVWVVGVPFLFWRLVYKARHRHIDTRLTLLESRAYRPLREKWLAEMRTMLAAEGRCVPLALGRRDEMAYLGHYMKTKNLEDSAVMARLGLIYQNYKSEFWWFDVFDLIRKVLLNGVLVFLQGNDIVQSTSGLALCLLALTLTLQCKPYRSWTDSLVAGVTQFQLFITLFLGFLLLMNTASTTALTPVVAMVDVYTISLLLVATNLASIVVAAGVLLHDTIRNRRRVRKVRAVRRAALISAAVRKLWRRAYNHAVGIAYANRPAPLSVALLIQRARRQPPPQTQDA